MSYLARVVKQARASVIGTPGTTDPVGAGKPKTGQGETASVLSDPNPSVDVDWGHEEHTHTQNFPADSGMDQDSKPKFEHNPRVAEPSIGDRTQAHTAAGSDASKPSESDVENVANTEVPENGSNDLLHGDSGIPGFKAQSNPPINKTTPTVGRDPRLGSADEPESRPAGEISHPEKPGSDRVEPPIGNDDPLERSVTVKPPAIEFDPPPAGAEAIKNDPGKRTNLNIRGWNPERSIGSNRHPIQKGCNPSIRG